MASCRFVPKKNLDVLLEAFAAYCEASRSPWELVLCGDGPMKEGLEAMTRELGISDHVRMPGFVQYEDLPSYYGLAQAFVHASHREQWGLVVNEAMAAGLPVLVSERCGCVPELVQQGVNGFTFPPSDAAALKRLLLRFSDGSLDPAALG